METEDIYVLTKGDRIEFIADDFEWLNMQTSNYSAQDQKTMKVTPYDLYRVKGKGD